MKKQLPPVWTFGSFQELAKLIDARIIELSPPPSSATNLLLGLSNTPLTLRALLGAPETDAGLSEDGYLHHTIRDHPVFLSLKTKAEFDEIIVGMGEALKTKRQRKRNRQLNLVYSVPVTKLKVLHAIMDWGSIATYYASEPAKSPGAHKNLKPSRIKDSMQRKVDGLLAALKEGGWKVLDFTDRQRLEEILKRVSSYLKGEQQRHYEDRKHMPRSLCTSLARRMLILGLPRRCVLLLSKRFNKLFSLELLERTVERCVKRAEDDIAEEERRRNAEERRRVIQQIAAALK